ncbi:MAG: hypothetical protein A3F11_02165 [Gammaproteobacteria bacterium RIFCSPHIGHO2_12_FULL_37_14]|nr:MAG: hypothetical protein A3F11_02165 [Gammaproteobacteria bacterium RIFCSPHIGHO2_12_FULL_37_14]
MSNRMKNKIVLITGAASGIGAATAKRLAAEGAIAIISDINETLGSQIAAEINSTGCLAEFLYLDVTDEVMWKTVFSHIETKYGRIDVLINNAGLLLHVPITEMLLADWHRLMAVNLDGVFLGTKHAIPLMKKSNGGNIVNVSSAAGIVGSATAAAYCASKGAVRLFTKAASLEYAKDNIRINSIHPGPIATSIFEKMDGWKDYVEQMGGEEYIWKAKANSTPLKRVGTPEEIANAILFLSSNESSYMTGCELIADGGFTAQ